MTGDEEHVLQLVALGDETDACELSFGVVVFVGEEAAGYGDMRNRGDPQPVVDVEVEVVDVDVDVVLRVFVVLVGVGSGSGFLVVVSFGGLGSSA